MSASTSYSPPPLLSLRGITKSFPGVLANNAIDLDIYPGEIRYSLMAVLALGLFGVILIIFGKDLLRSYRIVRSGLRELLNLEPDMTLVGEATGGCEAIAMTETLQPDVLVLDLNMPDLDGIEVTKRLKSRFPNLCILILTVYEDEALLREAIRAGASGYILKRATETELISAIYTVRRGDLYVDPKMIRVLFTEPSGSAKPIQVEQEPLSPREKEVLCLIVQGYTNRQIGEILKYQRSNR